ncbi:hypothetical protein BCR36DRAFT_582702 [Piromyces finnis]|uniref:Uncharacterized protein n=1 Tax=Piromyces finnis TaxID=1754191 RepID=A0A1Y1VD27_9FUNG|nr:hypothetical protein BCR36DRAFT_582702 [Piromyces finnis]|eukprot:ORX52194.1 hypothetical protein BCR36DRAFT_582702 [Piromyces finnis]
MESLGQKYLELKNIKGQYTGGEYNEVVDSESGEKYMVMNELLQELGKAGTSVERLCTLMGPPDTMSPILPGAVDAPTVPLMPGIALPAGAIQTEPAVYMIYSWRGMHDYIWFKLNSDESEVVEGGWKNN